MAQFKVGYYLFAILFLMFDVHVGEFGLLDFPLTAVFLCIIVWVVMPGGKELLNGSNYSKHALRGVEGQRIHRGSCQRDLQENGTNVVVGSFDKLINWGVPTLSGRSPLPPVACGIEFVSLGAARFDMARFGWEVARSSPRQADFMMVAGTIVHRMVPVFRRLYDQLAEPKYVIACGSCAISGGPFKKSYHVAMGIEDIVPVDVFIPGCPPVRKP